MALLIAQIVRSRWIPLAIACGIFVLGVTPVDAGPHALSVLHILPPCLFKRITGLPCPGCGMTRSLVLLAHGEVAAALVLNPIGLLLFPVLALLALAAFVPISRREGIARWIERRSRLFDTAGIAFGAALLANGVARIVWIVGGRHPSLW